MICAGCPNFNGTHSYSENPEGQPNISKEQWQEPMYLGGKNLGESMSQSITWRQLHAHKDVSCLSFSYLRFKFKFERCHRYRSVKCTRELRFPKFSNRTRPVLALALHNAIIRMQNRRHLHHAGSVTPLVCAYLFQ